MSKKKVKPKPNTGGNSWVKYWINNQILRLDTTIPKPKRKPTRNERELRGAINSMGFLD